MMCLMVNVLQDSQGHACIQTELDVRTLVDNDEGLQDGILQALEQYNTEQHITVTPPGLDYDVNKMHFHREMMMMPTHTHTWKLGDCI